MFNKLLIANRGGIAVRIIQTCRSMGVRAVAVYDSSDRGALHVRLADECVQIREGGYADGQEILRAAQASGAEAVHPGYGFLAEQPAFARACQQAGLTFVGPPAEVLACLTDKILALDRAAVAGFAVPHHSSAPLEADQPAALAAEAERLGYPLILKSCRGGRGRGTHLVRAPERLAAAARRAAGEAQAMFGSATLYLEHALLPSRYVEVTVLADRHGHLVHLYEHDGSLLRRGKKVVQETPAPYLSPDQRALICRQALEIARLFGCQGLCTVEFVLDDQGRPFFTEVKARIQVGHALCEQLTGVDLVREQLRIAAGEPLGLAQADLRPQGAALLCRINAEDPLSQSLPSPGRLRLFRPPGGPGLRVDTHVYPGCDVPVRYDPLLATLVVSGADRAECLVRAQRALADFLIDGVQSNCPLLQQLLAEPDVQGGDYTTAIARRSLPATRAGAAELRDLAVAAALAFLARTQTMRPSMPERLAAGWHRDARRLPE